MWWSGRTRRRRTAAAQKDKQQHGNAVLLLFCSDSAHPPRRSRFPPAPAALKIRFFSRIGYHSPSPLNINISAVFLPRNNYAKFGMFTQNPTKLHAPIKQ